MEKRVIETMEGIFEWLSQSSATSREEDEDFAKAIEIVKEAAAKHSRANVEAPGRAPNEPKHDAASPELSKALVRETRRYLKHVGIDILDPDLSTSAGEPVIAMRDGDVLALALLCERETAGDYGPVQKAVAHREARRRMEDVLDRFLETAETVSTAEARLDRISIKAVGNGTLIRHTKDAWGAEGSSQAWCDAREQLAALVDEYRGTGDCFEGCRIADGIVDLIESEVLGS